MSIASFICFSARAFASKWTLKFFLLFDSKHYLLQDRPRPLTLQTNRPPPPLPPPHHPRPRAPEWGPICTDIIILIQGHVVHTFLP